MSENLDKYQLLKRDYFKLLAHNSGKKGHLRALIGGIAAVNEYESVLNGEDGLEAHVKGFEIALDQVSGVNTTSNLLQKLDKVRMKWKDIPKVKSYIGLKSPILEPPIKNIGNWKHNGLNAVSLFSGAMGLDLGLMAAGFDVKLANDIDIKSKETVYSNLPELTFINRDIDTVTTNEILKMAELKKGELDVLVGGPPCQPFSPAGKRAGLSDPRASPLKYFIKAVKEMQPQAFVMEEVPGLLSSRLKHFPISESKLRQPLKEEKAGSAFKVVLEMLRSTGYNLAYGRLNAADFGSPQKRERLIFIGLKEGVPSLPVQTHSDANIGGTKPWNSFWEATGDLVQYSGKSPSISERVSGYMNYVPPGGNWRELPEDLIKEAMGGAFYAGGGKMGFYRRLSWDDPSPTVVTTPMQKGTMFIHPVLNRPISVREYARVQGFPEDWDIVGSLSDKYRLIGNAVPVHLSYSVAMHVKKLLKKEVKATVGGIYSYEKT